MQALFSSYLFGSFGKSCKLFCPVLSFFSNTQRQYRKCAGIKMALANVNAEKTI
jgi:hypothetical protein